MADRYFEHLLGIALVIEPKSMIVVLKVVKNGKGKAENVESVLEKDVFMIVPSLVKILF